MIEGHICDNKKGSAGMKGGMAVRKRASQSSLEIWVCLSTEKKSKTSKLIYNLQNQYSDIFFGNALNLCILLQALKVI